MVDKVGETMTAPPTNRKQWTTPSHGIPSSPDCRRSVDHIRSQRALLYLQPSPSGTTSPDPVAGTKRTTCMEP